MLTKLDKENYTSIDDYLQTMKNIADSLATIKSLVSNLNLIQFITAGLPIDYDTFVNMLSMMPSSVFLDDLRSK